MPGEAIYSGEDCTGVQVTPGCTLLRDRPFTTRTHMIVDAKFLPTYLS